MDQQRKAWAAASGTEFHSGPMGWRKIASPPRGPLIATLHCDMSLCFSVSTHTHIKILFLKNEISLCSPDGLKLTEICLSQPHEQRLKVCITTPSSNK